MELVIKVGAACIAVSVLCLLLRRDGTVFVPLLALAAAGVVFYLLSHALGEVVAFLRELTNLTALSAPTVGIVLKTAAIALVAGISGNICRDAGQSAVASAVDTASAVAALYVSLPLLRGVVSMIGELMT